ncbi:hypothetical protein BEP19_14510 [Ammoniphilus oxalaticus]|uniref:Uncharacterized protein n=1 Tax=Ammoniphilus oxalaticus TaxID=66863 RepID=A0A419SES7_9BACL|nr:peptidoglycan DD-metalloendopeptidase family protein [Ammoniphilus oxalaticus]RKD21822.1 hypothetical protein BEP19_14510 [Ammoniphilus oxalaticus]
MRKTPLLLVLLLSTSLLTPLSDVAASSIDKINQRITQIQKAQRAAESRISEIEREKIQVASQKDQAHQDLVVIDRKLKETQERISHLDIQIGQTTLKAQDAAAQLDEATRRVEERDELLKTRVKVMYEMGEISYLDVLLGSNSFGDFLDRLNTVRLIIDQDVRILEANIEDQKIIEAKKREIENHLASLQGMYKETSDLKADLERQQNERAAMIAQLAAKQEELERVRQQQEQAMLDLMHNMREALRDKDQALRQRQFVGGRFAWPVPSSNRITSNFGYRTDPFTGRKTGHDGIDIGAPQGTTIVAAADGVVVVASYVRGYGNMVSIDHGGDITTLYAHIRNGGIKVKVGQKVTKGQKIAEVGSTGRSTGPHLHFGVYKGRTVVDPMGYLRG